jgi:glutamyl-tRNA synthetase
MVRVRFAPSPTGRLHLGNARTAVLNALFAAHHGGVFVLRIDDTDDARCRPEYVQDIQQDLRWLGLSWDEEFAQSANVETHHMLFQTLKHSGRVYPCFETPEHLALWRQQQLSAHLPPRYDRVKGKSVPEHDHPYWRFALSEKEIQWNDLIQGPMVCDTRHLSDPVVMRQDGTMSYLLSSVMDDVDRRITHIIRGADHLTNTAIQMEMMRALGANIPFWAHFPLMLDQNGDKFSKRSGAKSLQELKEEGWLPLAIVQAVAQLGLSHQISGDFAHMASHFSLSEYSKSNGKFSMHDMELVQSRLWANMAYEDLSPDVQESIDPGLWPVVRNNIVLAGDIALWQQICTDPHWVAPDGVDGSNLPQDFCATAINALNTRAISKQSGEPLGEWVWQTDPWHHWVDAIMLVHPHLKKGLVARTLRMMLTARTGGPKMEDLLPLLPPKIVQCRLERMRDALLSPS